MTQIIMEPAPATMEGIRNEAQEVASEINALVHAFERKHNINVRLHTYYTIDKETDRSITHYRVEVVL
jgi:hypothetical protein